MALVRDWLLRNGYGPRTFAKCGTVMALTSGKKNEGRWAKNSQRTLIYDTEMGRLGDKET